jgi:hypothetical protein
VKVPATGSNNATESREKQQSAPKEVQNPAQAVHGTGDDDLARVIAKWRFLSPEKRRAILEIIEAV